MRTNFLMIKFWRIRLRYVRAFCLFVCCKPNGCSIQLVTSVTLTVSKILVSHHKQDNAKNVRAATIHNYQIDLQQKREAMKEMKEMDETHSNALKRHIILLF